jgi:hypothetical protein
MYSKINPANAYFLTATTSISIFAPFASASAANVVRAGFCGKYWE